MTSLASPPSWVCVSHAAKKPCTNFNLSSTCTRQLIAYASTWQSISARHFDCSMSFGVILGDTEPIKQSANFYVPCITPRGKPRETSHSSHVFLHTTAGSLDEAYKDLLQLPVLPKVTILISLPEWIGLSSWWRMLEKTNHRIAIIAPVTDDMHHIAQLREYTQRHSEDLSLVLELRGAVSKLLVRRYKCLRYAAVYLNPQDPLRVSEMCADATELMRKPASPALLLTREARATRTFEFWSLISKPRLAPFTDMLIDPLQPLAVDMDLEIYETFEKDRTKYRQYGRAIEMALSDLRHKHALLNILVIGPGRGPLLLMAMKFARHSDLITAVEKNEKCRHALMQRCEAGSGNVELVFADVREMKHSRLASFHLVVSELLGSFGCNEAAPEVLDVFRDLSPVMIPQEVRNYLQPIYTDIVAPTERPYLVRLSSYYPLCDAVAVFEYVYPGRNRLSQAKDLVLHAKPGESANALYGYFDACLYGPYSIGITPGQNCLEHCGSWFPMLFSIPETECPFRVRVSRASSASVSYRWEVNGVSYGQGYAVDLVPPRMRRPTLSGGAPDQEHENDALAES